MSELHTVGREVSRHLPDDGLVQIPLWCQTLVGASSSLELAVTASRAGADVRCSGGCQPIMLEKGLTKV